MAYKLTRIKDNIVKVETVEASTENDRESVDQFIEDITLYLDQSSIENPLKLLINASDGSRVTAYGRKQLAELGKDPRLAAFAVYNISRVNRVMITFVLKVTKRENAGFFDGETEALAWLEAY